MKKKLLIVSYISFALVINSSGQNLQLYTNEEKEFSNLFNKFKQYLITTIEKDVDIMDTVNIKYVLLNFLLPETHLDSVNRELFNLNEISSERIKEFTIQYSRWYNFYAERRKSGLLQHLRAIPLRLSSDKYIYDRLTSFQKKNTFVYFDDRNAKIPIGYILFLPKFVHSNNNPRILSWTLQFDNGYWAFRSVMGEVGIEYFISEGIKGPEHPIDK